MGLSLRLIHCHDGVASTSGRCRRPCSLRQARLSRNGGGWHATRNRDCPCQAQAPAAPGARAPQTPAMCVGMVVCANQCWINQRRLTIEAPSARKRVSTNVDHVGWSGGVSMTPSFDMKVTVSVSRASPSRYCPQDSKARPNGRTALRPRPPALRPDQAPPAPGPARPPPNRGSPRRGPAQTWAGLQRLPDGSGGRPGAMAKSKNHTAHNQSYKAHRNGIKKPKKNKYHSKKGVRSLRHVASCCGTPVSKWVLLVLPADLPGYICRF